LDLDDLQLVQQVRGGDRGAFRTLVERYQKRVFGQALGMLKDRDEAEDAAQEVFLRVHRHLEHFKGDSAFSTWLSRITSNVCIDALRRKRTGGEREAFDEAHPELPASHPGALASAFGLPADQAYLLAEAKQHHDAAVAQVPEKHRDIYELREREDLSYEELSERLKIPKGTVMSRLFHARDKVEKLFRPYAAPGADTSNAAPKAPPPDPAEAFLKEQMKAALSEALTRLPPKHREVLLLRELCQLSYPQLAEALGIAEALVPGRVFDARNRFQKLLSEYVEMRLNPERKKKADPRA
jgi:RNA polymerase sigma-70 factor (ECF subfamily)